MESVKIEITPGGRASRAEVIIRIFYTIIAMIILWIFGIAVAILIILNFFTCLILAARIAPEFIASYIKQLSRVMAYAYFVTDERPPLVP
jgi:K+-sensing histidine kinase KdpD